VAVSPPEAPPPVAGEPRRRPRFDPATVAVLAALVAVWGAWTLWARVNSAPGGGFGFGPLDSIVAASADRQRDKPAPLFVLADPNGITYALEDLRGQVVLLNFWASWCEPCKAEMPELDDLAREYRDAGFRVLAVNVLEDAESIRRFGEELELDLPLLVDRRGDVNKAYSVQGLPTSYLIDADGVIRDVRLGVVTRRYLESKLAGLLTPPTSSPTKGGGT
jgi:peroxiredoxin